MHHRTGEHNLLCQASVCVLRQVSHATCIKTAFLQQWFQQMIVPSLVVALQASSKLQWLGLTEYIPAFDVPLHGDLCVDNDTDKSVLLAHTRQSLELTKQLIQFVLVPQSFPWSFVRLLSEDATARQQCVDDARNMWDLILRLESSPDPVEQALSKDLFLKDVPVFRETMNLLQSADYAITEPLISYVKAISEHLATSLSLEVCLPSFFLQFDFMSQSPCVPSQNLWC